MGKRKAYDPTAPFQKIPDACRTTGLSQYYLRNGCKAGTVPHVRSGGVYYINVPEMMAQLKAQSSGATDGV